MVVIKGETEKLVPLFELPMAVPPLETVYQLMVFPADVALRFDAWPQIIDEGVAVTLVGPVGGPTSTVTAVRVLLVHPIAFHEILTCPFPELVPAVLTWLAPALYEPPPPATPVLIQPAPPEYPPPAPVAP